MVVPCFHLSMDVFTYKHCVHDSDTCSCLQRGVVRFPTQSALFNTKDKLMIHELLGVFKQTDTTLSVCIDYLSSLCYLVCLLASSRM